MTARRAVPDPTHAYVGYNQEGHAVLVYADSADTRRDCASQCARVIRGGGRVERVTVHEAQKIAAQMFRGKAK